MSQSFSPDICDLPTQTDFSDFQELSPFRSPMKRKSSLSPESPMKLNSKMKVLRSETALDSDSIMRDSKHNISKGKSQILKAGTFIDNDLGRALKRVNSNKIDLRGSLELCEQSTQRDQSSPASSQNEISTQIDSKEENEARNILLRANTVFDALTQSSQNSQEEVASKKRALGESSGSQSSEIIGLLESVLTELCDVCIIPGREITIGRRSENTIVIDEVHISGRQCKIVADEESVILEDTSFNGTFVNNIKIGKGNKQKLKPNDQITLSAPNTKYETIKVYTFYYRTDMKLLNRPLNLNSPSKSQVPYKKQKTVPYVSPTQNKVKSRLWKENLSSSQSNELPLCKYGNSCYRKNPDHFRQFQHQDE